MSNLRWEFNPNKTSARYTDRNGYSWGSVALVNGTTFGVFVRYEFREPARWVTHVDNLEDAKALVQTLVGANNV